MGKLIDGKALAAKGEEELKEHLIETSKKPLVYSILIGEDPASILYTNRKQAKASELGINFQPLKFSEDISFEEVAAKIDQLNEDPEVTGIMIQLPIPKRVLGEHSKFELLELINPIKDIDGLNPNGVIFMSATVKGVIKILDSLDLNYKDKVFAVVGSEGEVGKPLVKVLTQKGAEQIIKLDKRNSECNMENLKQADVVISCTGVQGLIKAEMIKEGAVLIDVGLGDFEESTYTRASYYTPKFGGVGPMTILSLTENILEASHKLNE